MTTRTAAAPPVPVVLVRLKLRLMRNRSRRGIGGLGLVLGVIAAGVSGLVGFFVAAVGGDNADPRIGRAIVVVGATVLVVGWSLIPLLAFGTDETLDPARLQLLPLERRPLMTGLLLSSLVGYGPFAVLLTLAGVVVGYGSGAGVVVTAIAVVLLVLLAAATARTLATALAATITSRRGRDVLIAVFASLGIGVQLLRFVNFGNLDGAFWDRVSNVARWFPPGMLGQAIVDSRTGHLARSVVELVPAIIVVPLLLAAWNGALERSLTVVTGGATKTRVAIDPSSASTLLPRRIPFLRPTPWGAVAAKELRYVARDPRRKIAFAQIVLFGVGGPVYIAIRSGDSIPRGSVVAASLAGYLAIVGAMNQFGFDGGAIWINIVAGNRIRDQLVGKNFALLVQVLPIVLVGSVILAAASGGWLYIPAALVIAAAGLGAGLAVANVVSVRYPVRVPETKSPFGGAAGGQGCVTGLLIMVAVVVQTVLLSPVAIAAAVCVAVSPVWLVVVAPACAAYGYGLWRAGVAIAERWAWWRQPELLLAVDPRRGA